MLCALPGTALSTQAEQPTGLLREEVLRPAFLALVVANDSGLAESVEQWKESRRLSRTLVTIWRSLSPEKRGMLSDFGAKLKEDPRLRRLRSELKAGSGSDHRRALLEASYQRARYLAEGSSRATFLLIEEVSSRLVSASKSRPGL